jgi:quinol monooxygenase YgiN
VVVTKGLLVRLEAKPGRDADVEEFLQSALPLVRDEPGTTAWYGIRFGRSEYGIVDFFPDDDARNAHLSGQVAQALQDRGAELFAAAPEIVNLDVLASKLPNGSGSGDSGAVSKGLMLTFAPKSGHERDAAQFLEGAQPLVEDEPKTIAWFALRLADGHYGIFDVFPDNQGRLAHMAGRVPREIVKNATNLLGSFPDMNLNNVLAYKDPASGG